MLLDYVDHIFRIEMDVGMPAFYGVKTGKKFVKGVPKDNFCKSFD